MLIYLLWTAVTTYNGSNDHWTQLSLNYIYVYLAKCMHNFSTRSTAFFIYSWNVHNNTTNMQSKITKQKWNLCTLSTYILNKNSLAVKSARPNQTQYYKQPKFYVKEGQVVKFFCYCNTKTTKVLGGAYDDIYNV